MKIFKYQLKLNDTDQRILLPLDATLIQVAEQSGIVCMWAIVDEEARALARWFRIFGTGQTIPPEYRYVGSCDMGQFVWHVFEMVTS